MSTVDDDDTTNQASDDSEDEDTAGAEGLENAAWLDAAWEVAVTVVGTMVVLGSRCCVGIVLMETKPCTQTNGRPRVEQGRAADLLRMIYRLNTATRLKMLVGPMSEKSPLSVDLSRRTVVPYPTWVLQCLHTDCHAEINTLVSEGRSTHNSFSTGFRDLLPSVDGGPSAYTTSFS